MGVERLDDHELVAVDAVKRDLRLRGCQMATGDREDVDRLGALGACAGSSAARHDQRRAAGERKRDHGGDSDQGNSHVNESLDTAKLGAVRPASAL